MYRADCLLCLIHDKYAECRILGCACGLIIGRILAVLDVEVLRAVIFAVFIAAIKAGIRHRDTGQC